jgi:hypothetical protein
MSCAAYTRCGACAKPLPKPAVGRPRKCCPTERCQIVYYGGNQRKRCARCHEPLPKGRAYQRAVICGACLLDLLELFQVFG